jgi:hypothetical protein
MAAAGTFIPGKLSEKSRTDQGTNGSNLPAMVVRITSPHSLKRALNYNEKKVQKGQAECIHAGNYILNPEQMKFHQKMERLQDLVSLNERTKKTNTLHISLNFDPSEKHSKQLLAAIAQTYMDKIGFGNQPYLAYQHNDAGHPHIHIVTVTIQPDGKRIDTYNIGRNQSEKARKEIEQDFNLIKAQSKKNVSVIEIIPANVQKAQYGKAETKRSITNVLDAVINQYKYTSLAELNAILKQYNVIADRGTEEGMIYKSNGMLYKLLDANGKPVGLPIKASSIYSHPTLKNLEKKFAENEIKRQPDKQKLKTSIDWVLSKSPASLKDFIEALLKERIQSILRQNKDGLVYGITFIDYRNKSVFNGSDLGKQYSIAGIQQKLNTKAEISSVEKTKKEVPSISKERNDNVNQIEKEMSYKQSKEDLLQQLTVNEKTFNKLPFELIKKKKRKRNHNS